MQARPIGLPWQVPRPTAQDPGRLETCTSAMEVGEGHDKLPALWGRVSPPAVGLPHSGNQATGRSRLTMVLHLSLTRDAAGVSFDRTNGWGPEPAGHSGQKTDLELDCLGSNPTSPPHDL